MKLLTVHFRHLLPSLGLKSVAKSSVALLLAAAMTGCGGVGSLASNPRVSDADNDQVVTIGDSIFALSGDLQDFLEDYAGETFRRYTLSGAELTGGVIATSIADQYEIARSDNSDIETIVMDGGGNDILIPAIMLDPYDCKTQWYEFGKLSSTCKNYINDIYIDGVNLLNDMHADGVSNVIYLGYYHTKNGLFLLDSMEEAVDYGDAKLAQACSYSAVNCEFVDPRSSINDGDIIFDGIHPNTGGSKKLADLVWPKLQPLL
ncbi:SGNH/GDSL hydrolase family protein [Hahella ganghwensis]|uniref:SGNH/GDSL hydrolase family protein n=1 Tax=Hahella ganghwensis TaxID=286420 RepID=UPI000371F926|nr:SGNH/GDSL hydrolase family protein [Hahella ganghwensis]